MEFGRYRGDPVQKVELQKVESKGRITKGRTFKR